MRDPKLEGLIEPKSIAVIGASNNPKKLGCTVVKNLTEGYKGQVYPINPKLDELFGLKCYHNIRDVPDDVDVAVIVVPVA